MTFALRLFPALLVLSASLHASDEAPGLPAMVERIIADRYLIHEQRPHGVVANWANEPRDGTTIDATVGSVNMWGQVYLGVDGDPEALASLRVEIKDIRLMCLTSDGVWHLLHSSATIDGAAYREDFAANEAISADRIINASTGSWAVQMVPNRNFHFWSGGSNGGWTSTAPYEINGLSTIVAMASAYKMRLVASDGVSAPDPDAVTRARLTASCGGDCKRKDDSYGWDWAEGRFRLLTAQWAPVTVATASREVLRTNPPPLFATSDPDWNSPAPVPGWSASDLGHPDNAGWITGQNFNSAGYGASIAGWRVSGGINREDQRITAAGAAPNGTPAAIFDTQGGNSPVAMTITGDAGVKYRPGALYWLRFNLWKGSTAFPYVGRFTYRVFAGDPASGGVQLGSGDVTGDIDGYEAWRNVSWPLSLMTNPMAVAGTPNLFVQFTADAPTNTVSLAQVQLDNIELTDIVTPPTSTTGYDGLAWTIAGAGTGFSSTWDLVRFVSRYVAGDHTLVTRIAAMSDTGANATAGLMIRESHAGGSPCVAVHRTGAGAVVMCWRTTEGGVMQSMTATGAGPASTWLRLARVGSTFTAAFSDNNVSWTTISSCSPTITLSPVLSGMAVSSSTKGVLNTVSFVGAEGPTVPAITSQPQSVTVAVSQTATFMITATGGPTPRYQWQRNGSDLAGAIAASYTTSATIAADSGATFRCLTINNMGSALSSPAILTVTQPPVGAVTSIRFYPRAGKEVRMVGGIFEGSNGTVDSGPFVTLATMNLIPAAGAWTSITSDKQVTAYRFLRYRSPVGSYGNVAEIAFLNNGTKLPGVGFGTSGSWNNSGNDWTKALDGDVISFLDCNQPDGAYVGIDTGTAPSITTHPANVTMADGQTATFAVAASGIPEPTYQWSSAPAVSTTFTAISGATSASYTTGMISNAMSGTKYRCEATNSVGSATSTAATLTVLVWRTNDIGAVAAAGSSVLSGGIWTLTGSGNDIWGTSDEFRFTSQPTRGDVVITAQVTGLQNTNAWAKAGVMVRETTGATSRHAFTCLTASNGAAFQRRRTTGGASVHTGGPAQLLAPGWVRLERVGNLFISSVSSTGTTWTEIRRETIVMDLAVHVGLAVTSHADGTLCTATFSNVTVVSVPVAMN